jgi:hypothetical protein
MTKMMFVADMVEENGKTIRQNNLEKTHLIPLGALVEVSYEDSYEEDDEKTSGIRLFVVNHSRDCDGTPLYDLSFSKKAYKKWKELDEKIKSKLFENQMDEALTKAVYWQESGKILRHYSEESLVLISE